MNPVQMEAFARQVLPIIGTLMTVLGVKAATANALIDMAMTVIGPLMTVVSVIWAYFANNTSAVISKAANLPEVQSIKLEPAVQAEVVNNTPTNVTK